MEITKKEPVSLKDIFASKMPTTKPPAYEWQDLALHVIKELRIPNIKKGSVFKICKNETKIFVEQCMNDTKELCKVGEPWKYFFKVVGQKGIPRNKPIPNKK